MTFKFVQVSDQNHYKFSRWSDLSGFWLWSSQRVCGDELGGDVFSWSTALRCKKKKLHPLVFRLPSKSTQPKVSFWRKEKKKKIQSVSVELDLMKSRTTTSLFFFLQIRPCPKHGVPTSSSACRLSTLALSQIPVDGSQSTVQIFLFFFKTHPIRISPVRFGSGTSRGRALKRSLIHPTFFSSPPVTQERVQRREGC